MVRWRGKTKMVKESKNMDVYIGHVNISQEDISTVLRERKRTYERDEDR